MFLKKLTYLFFLFLIFSVWINESQANQGVKGKILLQVESFGEAWYILPDYLERIYLGRPWQAFELMKNYGLGIRSVELDTYLKTSFPSRLLGYIVLDVERNGEAYYIYPNDAKAYYLGRPNDAFNVMRSLGLGISNEDLSLIPIISREVFSPGINELSQSDGNLLKVSIPDYQADLSRVISELSSPQLLISFLGKNFILEEEQSLAALSPEVFYQAKRGSKADFAAFISFILSQHKYQAGVIRYQYLDDQIIKDNIVVIFRDIDKPRYIVLDDKNFSIYHHGWSFQDLVNAEEKRIGKSIFRYVYFSDKEFDYSNLEDSYQWIEIK